MRKLRIWISAVSLLLAVIVGVWIFVEWSDALREQRILEQWKDPEADVNLASLLENHDSAEVRETTVRLLQQRCLSELPVGQAATAKLAAALHDSSPKVRLQAAKAFWIIGSVRRQARGGGIEASRILAEYLPDLLRCVEDASPDVREEITYALGYIADRRAVEGLLRLAKNTSENVRAAAVEALGCASEPRKFRMDVLSSLKDDPNFLIRLLAIGSIQELGGDTTGDVKEAETMLGHERAAVRRCAARLLGAIGSTAEVSSLRRVALSDTHLDVRLEAVWALAKIGGAGSVEALKDIVASAGTPEAVKTRARAVLEQAVEKEGQNGEAPS